MAVASLASKRIDEANLLLDKLNDLGSVEGISKLKKRIKAEISFLNKGLKKGSELKEEHVMCSNLGQLGAICDAASQVPQVVGVLQNFSNRQCEKIVVDVVAENGRQWIKVILRCPKALHLLYVMGGRRGVRPLDEVAEEFMAIASDHPVYYSIPQVVFWFFRGVSESLASDLESLGVSVKGTRIPDDELGLPDFSVEDSDSDCEDFSSEGEEYSFTPDGADIEKDSNFKSTDIAERSENLAYEPSANSYELDHVVRSQNAEKTGSDSALTEKCESNTSLVADDLRSTHVPITSIKKLNLDVTALIAYVTSTANGGANYIFSDKILTEQAMWERSNPVKATLDQYFQGCELLMCREAIDHFNEIISTIGGPAEKKRAQDFLTRIAVVPGEDIYKDQVKLGGKVRKLSRLIFGTGQAHRAITVTSNRGFVRSVEQQGIKPVVLYHEPRALTEMKEATASPLQSS